MIASSVTTVGLLSLTKDGDIRTETFFYFPILGGVEFISVKTPLVKLIHEKQ